VGRGTTVEVRDLFFNTPARRKFLHAPETELRHAQETLTAMALARPEVAVTLRHGGRTLIDAPPATDLDRRLQDLLTRTRLGAVRRFEAEGGGMRAWGLIALGSGKGRPQLTLLVNGRAVRDRLLVGAVLRVLREAGAGFGGARVALLLSLPPDAVDVNVHPAKAEVRFARSGAVFALVERAIRGAVQASQGTVGVARMDEFGGPPTGTLYPTAAEESKSAEAPSAPFEHPVYAAPESTLSPPPPVLGPPPAAIAQPATRPASGARPGRADTPFGRLIGQYRASFLLLEDDYGLVIVDQHVAHERVLYDRILRQLGGEPAPSQGLLEPLLIEVEASFVEALPRVTDTLARVGIEVDAFGPETVRVTALPPELSPAEAEDLVRDMLDHATALDGQPERAARAFEEDLAAGLSCRGAIKVNHPLADVAQRALLDDLARTENPYRCPHGRPIVLRLGQDEMERRLGRR
jgi:DNA mismatch repair protein MutL